MSASALGAVAERDDPAFRLFLSGDGETIRRTRSIVSSIVRFRAYFIPAHDRPDLEQEVLLDLWRAIGAPGFSFRNSYEGLVRAIAYRRCIDWKRARRVTASLSNEPVDASESVDRTIERRQEEAMGRRLLDGMRGPCRELFRLRTIEGLAFAEIAAIKGRSEMALRTQMSACLREARAAWIRLKGAGSRNEGLHGSAS